MRRYRIELFDQGRGKKAPAAPMSSHVDHILGELHELRRQVNSKSTPAAGGPQDIESVIAMWSGVEDIQRRLEVTRSEIGALYSKGVANEEKPSRTTDELRAVITGTEEATDTILAAAETIDAVAQRIAQSSDKRSISDGQMICDAVVQIFEACNFQDISGQRINKVVGSLQFIEERIASMIDVWQTLNIAPSTPDTKPESEIRDAELLNGPSLKSDKGVVSQDDVDAMFP